MICSRATDTSDSKLSPAVSGHPDFLAPVFASWILVLDSRRCPRQRLELWSNRTGLMPSLTPSPVIVNVYDLADFNFYLNWCGLGAYHSGLQVHGREYAYGAHPYECSGIFDTAPLEAPGDVSFRTSIYVGDTYYTADELEDLIAHMGREYLGRRYHLLQTNCNSFTSDACFALCGERAPGWINRLAGVALAVHCLCPTSWVPPLQPPSMVPNFDDLPSAQSVRGGMPVAESQQARPYLMERLGSDEQVVTMTSHGRNRNTGRVPVLQYAEPVPRGNSPSKLAASSGKTLSVVHVEGDSGGLRPADGRTGHSKSRRKRDGNGSRDQTQSSDLSDLIDYDE